jgi:hypothetical protein
LISGDGMVSTTGGHRVEFDSRGKATRTPLNRDAQLRLLVEELGMSEELVRRLPPDKPTPPPPWAKSAPRA